MLNAGYICYLQELRMYNPNYLERPYIVVLNKIDLPAVCVFDFPPLYFLTHCFHWPDFYFSIAGVLILVINLILGKGWASLFD